VLEAAVDEMTVFHPPHRVNDWMLSLDTRRVGTAKAD